MHNDEFWNKFMFIIATSTAAASALIGFWIALFALTPMVLLYAVAVSIVAWAWATDSKTSVPDAWNEFVKDNFTKD